MLVARLEPENNIETILDGYLLSNQKYPFIVVGNNKAKYGEYLKLKYAHNSKIRFIGRVYVKNIINSLRHFCYIYFHGHAVGGTNPSLLEAMACSALIASFDINFNRNILGNDCLYFRRAEDIPLIIDEKEHASCEGFTDNNLIKIKTEYTWEKVVDAHEKLFLSVID